MAILEPIATLVGLTSTIWDGINNLRIAALNKDGVIIAYRYEVSANLALIRELDPDKLKDAAICDPAFRNFVMCLATQVGASILYDANRKNYSAFMNSLNAVRASLAPVDEGAEQETVTTLRQAMHFSVRKIDHLKRLALCAAEGSDLFHEFRLKVRVKNIEDSLSLILKNLPAEVNP